VELIALGRQLTEAALDDAFEGEYPGAPELESGVELPQLTGDAPAAG
jgi:hypothetical protein